MTDPRQASDEKPVPTEDIWARRRGKNIALLIAIFGLCALFFVITILRMG